MASSYMHLPSTTKPVSASLGPISGISRAGLCAVGYTVDPGTALISSLVSLVDVAPWRRSAAPAASQSALSEPRRWLRRASGPMPPTSTRARITPPSRSRHPASPPRRHHQVIAIIGLIAIIRSTATIKRIAIIMGRPHRHQRRPRRRRAARQPRARQRRRRLAGVARASDGRYWIQSTRGTRRLDPPRAEQREASRRACVSSEQQAEDHVWAMVRMCGQGAAS